MVGIQDQLKPWQEAATSPGSSYFVGAKLRYKGSSATCVNVFPLLHLGRCDNGCKKRLRL